MSAALAACSRLTWAATATAAGEHGRATLAPRAPQPRRADLRRLAHRLPDSRRSRPAMTTGAPAPPPLDADLEALLRRMRLPHIRRAAPEVLATAKAQRWEPAEVLARPAHRGSRRPGPLRAGHPPGPAAFPTGKTFAAWDDALSSIPAPTQPALRTLEWIRRHENLVVCGPSGTGKTFLLEALGQPAVEAGMHVAWFTLEDLGVLVRRHRADDTVTKAIARILRADLVIVDDIGLLPVGPDAAEGLYRLVDAAYEKRSRRDQLEPAPRRVRRAHAQDPGHRHRRPAPAPRPRLPDHRRQRPPVPGPRRKRGQALDLNHPGTSGGRHRADPMATTGQFS